MLVEFADWCIILAFLGMIAAAGAVGYAVLHLKNGTVRNAKRLYERPATRVKTIFAIGARVAARETARFHHVERTVKRTSTTVKETAVELGAATGSLRDMNWSPVIEFARQGLRVASIMADIARSAPRQGPAPDANGQRDTTPIP
ncbi:MAG: hypothetical protein ACLQVD_10380 [Capsulimonadaceae bacterium]